MRRLCQPGFARGWRRGHHPQRAATDRHAGDIARAHPLATMDAIPLPARNGAADGRFAPGHNRTMATRSERRWREPPILFQILLLLLGGLVVAQFVTLLLTLVLPPAPPVQHRLGDVAAALRGERSGTLVRRVQPGPPAVGGPGWFVSRESQARLAEMLGTGAEAVQLAFYAPLPFAGTAATPPPPEARPIGEQPVAWQVAPGPIMTREMRLRPIALLEEGPPPGGGPGGGGFPGGFGGGQAGGMGPGGCSWAQGSATAGREVLHNSDRQSAPFQAC